MKYEVTLDEKTHLVDIVKNGHNQYTLSIDDGPKKTYEFEELSDDLISILLGSRSLDVGRIQLDDALEIEIKGERYLAEVVDPRKKALRMASASGGDKVITRMPGRVIEVCAEVGQEVSKGDVVIIVEAMKMENPLKAPRDGIIDQIHVANGDVVDAKSVLLSLR